MPILTKGGFYWHFADRRALLEALLETWKRVMVDEVIARLEGEGGDARARLRHLWTLSSSSGEWLAIELAVRDWARRDDAVAGVLRRVDNRRIAYLRTLFGQLSEDPDDVEARCAMAMALFVGFRFIAADHGGRSRTEVVRLAGERLLAP